LDKGTKVYLRLKETHNGELAKKYQVSPVLTRKECPAKVGVRYL